MNKETLFIGTITAPVGLCLFTDRKLFAGNLDDHMNHTIKLLSADMRKNNAYSHYEITIDAEEHVYGDFRYRQLYTRLVNYNYDTVNEPIASAGVRKNKTGEWELIWGNPSPQGLLIYNCAQFILDKWKELQSNK